MGHPNEDLIRQGYDAFSRGDMDTLREAYAERQGRTLEDNTTLVFHVRDGKATEVWQYWADPYAADELFA